MGKVKRLSFRITDIVIRCPHCGRVFRLAVALVETEKRPRIEPEIEDGG